ncbi:hypothetical protein SCLCIDRAFT_1218513 [Scleroderma citrinum Foug A]|uniref:Uncharacterized protein n=1 Tax=Scleroderma citrinum Foug A TaxID=1036808 RepID=A0A0C2Z9J6_9AGAM|nr:hypothetical protein SCLCIDRAFT_1218513 [Scleroderma citrinum Foug A]
MRPLRCVYAASRRARQSRQITRAMALTYVLLLPKHVVRICQWMMLIRRFYTSDTEQMAMYCLDVLYSRRRHCRVTLVICYWPSKLADIA